MSENVLHLNLRTQRLVTDDGGHQDWEVVTTPTDLRASETALVLCDVWDNHWCRGSAERLDKMVPRMNEVVSAARAKGVLIAHAPSGTMERYADHPARQRVLEAPEAEPPEDLEHDEPPLPIQTHDPTSCDTPPDAPKCAWSSQHEGVTIDPDADVISDDGHELYCVYHGRGISNVLILGVHTNMCVLGRSFGIKQLVRWGLNTAIVRDLTDAQYSPAQWPYVSRDEGTRLMVEYLEKFWCPSVMSDELPV